MATNRETFYGLGQGKFIPREISFYAGGLLPKGDSLDEKRADLSRKVDTLISTAPRFLQDRLYYSPFCQEAGLMVTTTINSVLGRLKIEVPQTPFENVAMEELVGNIKWHNFMDKYQLPRDVLVRNVAEVVRMIPREDPRYLDAWDITMFDNDMEIGGYKAALSLIPDLSDDEVKVLFNNLTSIRSIRQKLSATDTV